MLRAKWNVGFRYEEMKDFICYMKRFGFYFIIERFNGVRRGGWVGYG